MGGYFLSVATRCDTNKQANKYKDRIVNHINLRIISCNLLSNMFRLMWTDASTSQRWRSSRDMAVITTIGVGTGRSGARIPTGTEVLEMSVYSSFNHLTRLLAREYFNEEIFLFSKTFTPTPGPTEPPIQRVPGFFPGGKSAGAWCSPLTSILRQG
jgi:hypothetical protein